MFGIRYARFSRMISPKQPMAARQVADGAALLRGDPAGEELGDPSRSVDDAERGVGRAHQLAHPVHDQLQHLVDVEHAADATHRGIERLDSVRQARAHCSEDRACLARGQASAAQVAADARFPSSAASGKTMTSTIRPAPARKTITSG